MKDSDSRPMHERTARDINGDGKDEVMGGYSMVRPDGTTMWTVPGGDPDSGASR